MKQLKNLSLLLLLLLAVSCTKPIEEPAVNEPAPLLSGQEVAKLEVAQGADQLVIVGATTESNAHLFFFEKNNGVWEEIFTTDAYIGQNGLGKTKEGDGKTPVGTYHFTKAFGIAPDPGCALGYTQVDKTHYWVDDSSSRYYNQLVSTKEKKKKFNKKKSEHLIEFEKPYQYCLNISYNEEGKAKLGSAIFLHCFSDNPYTAGGIEISEPHMQQVLTKVKPGCKVFITTFDELKKSAM